MIFPISSPFLMIFGVLLAYAVDSLYGEYPATFHPVVWIGSTISYLDTYFRRLKPVLGGALFILAVQLIFLIPVYFILRITFQIWPLYLVIYVYLLKSTFSIRSMSDHIEPIVKSLESGDLDTARKNLSMVVRRNTESMDASLISSAAIETIAEGYVDGVLSPLFYFAFLGVIGAIFFRIANTFDSNIAYKDSRNYKFGRYAALLDTVLNYIPARISAFFIYIACAFVRITPRAYDMVSVARITDSTNAGWPMGAIANCLGVRLEKPGEYVLGESFRSPNPGDIISALRIFRAASILFIIFFTLPVVAFLYIIL